MHRLQCQRQRTLRPSVRPSTLCNDLKTEITVVGRTAETTLKVNAIKAKTEGEREGGMAPKTRVPAVARPADQSRWRRIFSQG